MLQTALHSTLVLCKLKLRLLANSLSSWASAGKVLGAGFGIIVTAVALATSSSELIDSLRQLPYAELMLDWIMAAIVFYGIFIVFTGDLITGHTMGAGQMSHDFTFLCTLPIPPLSLILVKLFERLITDFLGILILFSAFLGITCRDGITLSGVTLSIILFLQVSLLIGLGINLVIILLKRFFRTATINNFFSLLGYLSAFLTIVPYLIFSNFPSDSLAWVLENLDLLNDTVFRFMVPAKWLGICLINKSFCDAFFYFTAFWAAMMLSGTALFYAAIRLNWLHYSHSTANRATSNSRRWFSGFMQKEITLITSDYNLAINAILMPVSIIAVEIYFLKQFLNLSAQSSLLNIISGAVIYFCMFGPMNAIGSEGKAIAVLETMPLSPADILKRKFIFWLVVAEAIFMPAAALTLYLFNYNPTTMLHAVMVIAIFTAACVWASISISAIFAIYDSKMLQQRSTFAGKLAALGIMLLAAPIKDWSWLTAYNAVIFICLGLLLHMKASIYIFYRLDEQSQSSETHKRLDLMLIFFAFAGAEVAIRQFFLAVIPGQDTGLWSWALPVFFLAPLIAMYYMSQRSQTVSRVSNTDPGQPQVKNITWLHCIITVGLVSGASYFLAQSAPQTVTNLRENLGTFVSLGGTVLEYFGYIEASANMFNKLTALAIIALAGSIAWFATLLICRNFLTCSQPGKRGIYRLLGLSSLALLVPAPLVPVALFIGTGITNINSENSNGWAAATMAAMSTAIITAWLLFF